MSGQVDAIGCSTTVAAQIAKRAPADTYEHEVRAEQQVMAVAMRPGQDDAAEDGERLRRASNKANGELNKLYQKWLGTDFPAMPGS